jgi:hypothetical protein
VQFSVLVDTTFPEKIKFLEAPAKLRAGESFQAKLKAESTSDIRAVNFFVGEPTMEGKVPPNTKTFKGKVDRDGVWSAKVDLPAGKDLAVVSAEVINGVELSKCESIKIELLAANQPGKATGTIKGKVTWDDRRQPKRDVILTDSKGGTKKAATDEEGEFAFEDLAPGKYTVTSSKGEDKGAENVEVEAGKTVETTIKLRR